jgi:CubicO group peptidase (beta-lactamase class C family)
MAVKGISLALGLAVVLLADDTLGPGDGTWQTAAPEAHGLSTATLEKAASRLHELVPQRYCLVVAKDGKLVHESYFANTSETLYETDSAGKVMTAALMGVLVQKGLLDIDRPIKQYGVKPKQYLNHWENVSFLWNKTGVDFFDNVTTRHLLTQTNGYGLVPPGADLSIVPIRSDRLYSRSSSSLF